MKIFAPPRSCCLNHYLSCSALWWKAGGLTFPSPFSRSGISLMNASVFLVSQVKEAMQRIHDRGNIGKLILDVEKTPTPLVSGMQRKLPGSTPKANCCIITCSTADEEGNTGSVYRLSKTRGDQMTPEWGISHGLRWKWRKTGKLLSEDGQEWTEKDCFTVISLRLLPMGRLPS